MPGNRWVVAAGFLLLALGLVWCAREPLSQVEVVRAVYAPIEVTVRAEEETETETETESDAPTEESQVQEPS